jgi:hypothetical protein
LPGLARRSTLNSRSRNPGTLLNKASYFTELAPIYLYFDSSVLLIKSISVLCGVATKTMI